MQTTRNKVLTQGVPYDSLLNLKVACFSKHSGQPVWHWGASPPEQLMLCLSANAAPCPGRDYNRYGSGRYAWVALTLCYLSEYRPERCPHDIRYIPGRLSSTSNRGLRHCVPRQLRQLGRLNQPSDCRIPPLTEPECITHGRFVIFCLCPSFCPCLYPYLWPCLCPCLYPYL
jgi:hypothetical protein